MSNSYSEQDADRIIILTSADAGVTWTPDTTGGGGGGGVTDHGALTGLADDDHTQYALADGSRGTFEVAGAVATHAGLADPHPTYLTAAEGAAAYDAIGAASAAVATHVGLGDPHTQYALESALDESIDDRVAALIQNGTGISWTYSDVGNTLTPAVSITQYTDEMVDDRVSSLLVAGNNIDLTYNDGANTLTVDVEALTSADLSDFTEAAQDVIGALLVDSSTIDFTYNDAGNAETVAVIQAGLDHGSIGGLTDDDHSQYALLAGRSGGQTLIGGTASGDDLILKSTSHSTLGTVQIESGVELFPTSRTLSAAGNDYILLPAACTLTLDFASAYTPSVINCRDTVKFKQSAFVLGGGDMFVNARTYINDSGVAANLNSVSTLKAACTFSADTQAITMAAQYDIIASLTLSRANAGTLALTDHQALRLLGPTVGAGTTLTTSTRVLIGNGTNSGTFTTQIGIDIANLAAATTNIGIRNAATAVYTPKVSTITAVGSTIAHDARVIRLDNTSGSSKTLTSAPTISDGQDGEMVTIFNGSAQNVVIQDQGTLASSNLRLTATTLTLGTRDSVTLMYSSTVGDWIQVATLVNVL
jgi:hypothetical protein